MENIIEKVNSTAPPKILLNSPDICRVVREQILTYLKGRKLAVLPEDDEYFRRVIWFLDDYRQKQVDLYYDLAKDAVEYAMKATEEAA